MRIWKEIPNTNGIYFVSNDGLVKSVDHYVQRKDERKRIQYGRILKPTVSRGYLSVKFSLNGKKINYTVHRLVALVFIPNLENKREVNHIDGNKSNNRIENLEWVTRVENSIHAVKNNLIKQGEEGYNSKFKNNQISIIRDRIKNGETIKKIAKEFNISHTTISKIYHNKTYKNV